MAWGNPFKLFSLLTFQTRPLHVLINQEPKNKSASQSFGWLVNQ